MSNTHIRTAVESVVADQGLSGYPQATAAVEAIVAKMEALADSAAQTIREAADGVASSDAVEQVLIDSGLVVPEPVPTVEQPVDEDRLTKVETAVASLKALASRLGYSV